MTDAMSQIADLLRQRNQVDNQIAHITGRPMTAGHLGEWIAAEIFDIELETSAAATAIDGRFRSGLLQGKTVNIKWYLKQEGLLDMTQSGTLDYYLVMTGPPAAGASSAGTTRPWRIDNVYLFDSHQLLAEQRSRGVKIGVASSVPHRLWTAAQIYPADNSSVLRLTNEQSARLGLLQQVS